jgi:hypothetical protein
MDARIQDRLLAACGIAFVVVELAGAFTAMAAGKTHNLTISSTNADIANALAKPAGIGVWIGAYLEFLSVGFFLAFTVWICAKLGGGILGSIGRGAAIANAAVTIASLAVMATVAHRAGHGMGVQLGAAFSTFNEALFVGTWFLTVFFLVPVGALALNAGRRVLGWSALAIAGVTLLGVAVSIENLGQFSQLFWLAWAFLAAVAFLRESRAPAHALATA